MQVDDLSLGDTTTFKGDAHNLKVMAGMKIKLGDQVRTVVTDIAGDEAGSEDAAGGRKSTAYFYVDEPFARNAQSEEVDGVDYHFLDESTFQQWIDEDRFLEHAQVFGRSWYGTPREPVDAQIAEGRLVLLDIDGNPNYKTLEQRKFRVDMIKQKKKVKVSSSNRDIQLNQYGDKLFNDTPN